MYTRRSWVCRGGEFKYTCSRSYEYFAAITTKRENRQESPSSKFAYSASACPLYLHSAVSSATIIARAVFLESILTPAASQSTTQEERGVTDAEFICVFRQFLIAVLEATIRRASITVTAFERERKTRAPYTLRSDRAKFFDVESVFPGCVVAVSFSSASCKNCCARDHPRARRHRDKNRCGDHAERRC